jgi:asparagine synthase (glutamine-hydrolysing)
VLQPNVAESLPTIARAYGEPFADPSAVPSYFLSQAAARYTKVVLNGDGGDELFCGYRRHFAANLLGRLHRWISPAVLAYMARAGLHFLPVPRGHRNSLALAYRLMRLAAAREQERMSIWRADSFNPAEKQQLLLHPLSPDEPPNMGPSYPEDIDLADDLERIIRMDFESGLPDNLLVKMDIASMSHSLEARSPLLDQELAQYVFSLPKQFLVNGRTTKPFLRAIAAKYLPAEVVTAPKRGFELPLHRWLDKDLSQMRDDLLLERSGILADYFRQSYLESLLRGRERDRLPTGRWVSLVWILLMLALWDRYGRIGAA